MSHTTHYSTIHTPIIATGKEGRGHGKLFFPCGVAIHEVTHQICVANYLNHRVDGFSEMGEFLYQLGLRQRSATSGPRAKSGPRGEFIRPAALSLASIL